MELLVTVCAQTPVTACAGRTLTPLHEPVGRPKQSVEIVSDAPDVARSAGHGVEYDQRLPAVRSDRPENSVDVLGRNP